jgi:hypothetical protein
LRRAGTVVALVDESGYLERLGPQAAGRAAERAALWRHFCEQHGTPVAIVNLDDPRRRHDDLDRLLAPRMPAR